MHFSHKEQKELETFLNPLCLLFDLREIMRPLADQKMAFLKDDLDFSPYLVSELVLKGIVARLLVNFSEEYTFVRTFKLGNLFFQFQLD